MKKLLLMPLTFTLLAIVIVGWFYMNAKPVSSDKNFRDFLIVKGSGAAQIGNKLYKEGIIKSSFVFKVYVQVTGKAEKIQAGEYRLSPSFSLFEIVNQLGRGPIEMWVTIPEGLRREEIASRFSKVLDKNETFAKEFLKFSEGKEGYLFPDTYLFPKTASASAIINKMTKTFAVKTAPMDLSQNQIILASLIERETKNDEERPIVAGILTNRLNVGMALQIDATIQYAKGNWEPVTSIDKSLNSLYNTYKFTGFPPGPIANPGLSSLEAAANPENTDYFYYLHDPKGKIHYAKTLAEHNENVRKYLTD